MRLQDKVAIVTGGAQGIGEACARAFAAEGALVVIADVADEKGENVAESIRATGAAAIYQSCDVGDSAAVSALMARALDEFGGVDIMLSNAAILHACDFLDLSEEDFDRVVRINLKGYFLTGQAAARQMVEQGRGGAIINMSSINAVVTIPAITSYAVCKGGVAQLTRSMALALADKGVRVNAIGPGTIATDMGKTMVQDAEARHRVMSRTPMGRLGEPEEIAAVAVFLASDESSYITGETIYADGGRLPLNYTVPVKD